MCYPNSQANLRLFAVQFGSVCAYEYHIKKIVKMYKPSGWHLFHLRYYGGALILEHVSEIMADTCNQSISRTNK